MSKHLRYAVLLGFLGWTSWGLAQETKAPVTGSFAGPLTLPTGSAPLPSGTPLTGAVPDTPSLSGTYLPAAPSAGTAPGPVMLPASTPPDLLPLNAVPPKQLAHSAWMVYSSTENVGGGLLDGPIDSEAYFRVGPSVPFHTNAFTGSLDAGFGAAAGVRVLFFNAPVDAAWVWDLGIANHYNHSGKGDVVFPLRNIVVQGANQTQINRQDIDVTTRYLNRTLVNFGLGREIYLAGTGIPDGLWNWRAGYDAAARWGSSKLGVNELKHRTDAIYGALLAVHTDVEVPLGRCMFNTGLRLEWAYTSMDILQSANDTNIHELTLFVTMGLRF